MPTDDGEAPDAFLRSADFTRTATVTATRDGVAIEAGIRDLAVMKTGRSAFRGFPRDVYTTLPGADDRIMATLLTAAWRYGEAVHGVNFEKSTGGASAAAIPTRNRAAQQAAR